MLFWCQKDGSNFAKVTSRVNAPEPCAYLSVERLPSSLAMEAKRPKTHHDNDGDEQTMIAWREGLVQSPDGPAREIPQKHAYSRALFVTRDGAARARIFNFVSQTWSWEDDPVEPTMHEDGRLGKSTSTLCSFSSGQTTRTI